MISLIQMIDIDTITPVHDVQDEGKLATITADMTVNGWTGRPLLVLDEPSTYQAVTGAHRYAAAVAAGLTQVPCIVLTAGHIGDAEVYNGYGNVCADNVATALWDNGYEELHGICH